MYKNIVVFGPDNSGKTSLCETLSKLSGGKYIHSLGPVSIDNMINFMETELKDHTEIKIFDRFPILEEYVYGKILRGENKFNNEEYNKEILSKIDLFIFCNPGIFNMLNWGSREQMSGVKENAVEIINAFNFLAEELKNNGYNIKEYNYNLGHPERLLDDISNLNTDNHLIKCSLMVYRDYLDNLNINGCEGLTYSEIQGLINRVDNIIKEYY